MREILDLPEHFITQSLSEGSNNSHVKLLLEFILCVRCFVSIFVRLDLGPHLATTSREPDPLQHARCEPTGQEADAQTDIYRCDT